MVSKKDSKDNGSNDDVTSNDISSTIQEIFKIFDSMSLEYGCYCVRRSLDDYLFVAGYPETRVDHARSCLEFALALNQFSVGIQDSVKFPFHFSIAVNTGSAFAAVLGQSRLAFDLIGDDIVTLEKMRYLCKPNRVLVTRSTFEQLPEGYRGEIGPNVNLFNRPPLQTFYVQTRNSKHLKNQLENYFPCNESISSFQYFSKLLRILQEYNIRMNTSISYKNVLFDILRNQRLCDKIMCNIRRDEFSEDDLSLANQLSQAGFTSTSNNPPKLKNKKRNLYEGDSEEENSEDVDLFQLKWPCTSPNGLLQPNWLTLAFHSDPNSFMDHFKAPQKASYKELSLELENKNSLKDLSSIWHSSDLDRAETMKSLEEHAYHQSQRPRLIASTVSMSLIILSVTFIVQFLVMPRTYELLVLNGLAYFFLVFLLTYITVQRLKLNHKSIIVRSYGIRVFVLIFSLMLILLANQINLFSCQFGIWARNTTLEQSNDLLVVISSASPVKMSLGEVTARFCPLPGYIILIGCILCLLPLIICPPPTISQSLRIGLSFAILTIEIITMTFILSSNNNEMNQYNNSILINGCIAQISFTLVTIFLPRILDLLNRLTYLWKLQHGFDSIDYKGCLDGFCRLLLSILPKHMVLFIFDTTYATSMINPNFSESNSWLSMICLNISFANSTSPQQGSKNNSINPTKYADNVRRLNHVISLIDYITNYGQGPLKARESLGSKLHQELITSVSLEERDLKFIQSAKFPGVVKVSQYGSNMIFAVGLTNKNLTIENKTEVILISMKLIQTLMTIAKILNERRNEDDDRIIFNFSMDCDSSITSVLSDQRISYNLWSKSMTLLRILSTECLTMKDKPIQNQPIVQSRVILTDKVYSLLQRPIPSNNSLYPWIYSEFDLSAETLTSERNQVYMNHQGDTGEGSFRQLKSLYIFCDRKDDRFTKVVMRNIVELMKARNFIKCEKLQKRQSNQNNPSLLSELPNLTKMTDVRNSMIASNHSVNAPIIPPAPPPHQRSYDTKKTSNSPLIYQNKMNGNFGSPLLISEPNNFIVAPNPVEGISKYSEEASQQKVYMNSINTCANNNNYSFDDSSNSTGNNRLPSVNGNNPVAIAMHQNQNGHQMNKFAYNPPIKPTNPFVANETRGDQQFGNLKNSASSTSGSSRKHKSKNVLNSSSSNEMNMIHSGDRNNNNINGTDRKSMAVLNQDTSHHNPLYTDNEYDSMLEANNDPQINGKKKQKKPKKSKAEKKGSKIKKVEEDVYYGPVSIIAHPPSEKPDVNNEYNGFTTDMCEDISELDDNLSMANSDLIKRSFMKENVMEEHLNNFSEKIISKIGKPNDDSQEEIFAYHNGQGNGFRFSNKTPDNLIKSGQAPKLDPDQYLEPKDIDTDYSTPLNNNQIHSSKPNDNVQSIPCVIHLASHPLVNENCPPAYLTNGSSHTVKSEYDNVTRKSGKSSLRGDKPSPRKLLIAKSKNNEAKQKRFNKRRRFFGRNSLPGEESDTMSGYNGDASVYNSDEEILSDENSSKMEKLHKKIRNAKKSKSVSKSLYSRANDLLLNSLGRKSDYENVIESEVYVNTGSKVDQVQQVSNQRIAEEAKRITQKLQYIELCHENFNNENIVSSKKEVVLQRNSDSSQEENILRQTNISKSFCQNQYYRHSVMDPWASKQVSNSKSSLLKGKSLSTMCLFSNVADKNPSETNRNSKVFLKNNKRLAVIKNRADKVRSLLPPSLAQFILPGCVSSLSDTSDSTSSEDDPYNIKELKMGMKDLDGPNSRPKRILSNPNLVNLCS